MCDLKSITYTVYETHYYESKIAKLVQFYALTSGNSIVIYDIVTASYTYSSSSLYEVWEGLSQNLSKVEFSAPVAINAYLTESE